MGKEKGQQPIEPGNITLAYPFSDGFKHTIWERKWADWASPSEKNGLSAMFEARIWY